MKWVGRISLSWLLVWMLFICPVFAASTFPDVDAGAEYADAVACVKDMGIMVGDEQGNFNPNKSVTRAEMATLICHMLGETEGLTISSAFSDVPIGHWANIYINRAMELGIASGYGNGKFGPSDPVTYEQAVTMLLQAIGSGPDAVNAGGYPDGYIDVADRNGYLENISAKNGDQMMRWQVAVLCYNVMLGGNVG